MASKSYVVDLPGGTNTSTIQITAKATIRKMVLTFINAAVGKTELSTSATSQIGTAQPTSNVVARVNHSATAGNQTADFEFVLPVVPFQSLYIHQTGAGNLGTAVLTTS